MKNPESIAFAEALQNFAIRNGESVYAIYKKANVPGSTYQSWKQGKCNVTPTMRARLVRAFPKLRPLLQGSGKEGTPIDAGSLRQLAVKASVDPRSMKKVLRGQPVRGMAAARARKALGTGEGMDPTLDAAATLLEIIRGNPGVTDILIAMSDWAKNHNTTVGDILRVLRR